MRRAFYILAVILLSTELCAKEYLVHGPQGGLDTCPMVILMHGIFSSNKIVPIPALARELSKNGIASISFDFGGHWKSEGEMQHMTVGKEIEDALVLVAPGSVIQDACRNGKFFGAEFNPADPPEYVKCFGIMKLGREYILSTQELDIYGTAKAYTGPVRLIHGNRDTIVPLSCSEKFVESYNQEAENCCLTCCLILCQSVHLTSHSPSSAKVNI